MAVDAWAGALGLGWQEVLTALVVLWALITLGRLLLPRSTSTARSDSGAGAACGGCSGCGARSHSAMGPLVSIDQPTEGAPARRHAH